MARWPPGARSTLITYGIMFVLFPLLCYLAYVWVKG